MTSSAQAEMEPSMTWLIQVTLLLQDDTVPVFLSAEPLFSASD